MNLEFYAAFFGLGDNDRKAFAILAEEDETLEGAISSCAAMWRGRMREIYKDPVMCRQAFLARAVILSAKSAIKGGYGGPVAAAFALFLCDRVEQRVRSLDFEEENSRFRP